MALTPEQRAQISTPSYKLKKEKREAKRAESSKLVDPSTVLVIGVVGQQETVKSPSSSSAPPEKKSKKEKLPSKAKKSTESSSTDTKIAELGQKWSDQFNRLEALLLARTLQPVSSSDVKVTPPHSPPPNIPKDSEPFFQPTGCTGTDSSAVMHQSASHPESDT